MQAIGKGLQMGESCGHPANPTATSTIHVNCRNESVHGKVSATRVHCFGSYRPQQRRLHHAPPCNCFALRLGLVETASNNVMAIADDCAWFVAKRTQSSMFKVSASIFVEDNNPKGLRNLACIPRSALRTGKRIQKR